MAVTYKNNWKNILTALLSKVRAEMKCPVFTDWNMEKVRGNQFIRIIPQGSSQTDKATHMEVREFDILCQYYFLRRKDKNFQDYVLNQVSIFEALIHDNITLTLADNSKAINLTLSQLVIDVDLEEYEDYFVCEWQLNCTHFGNTA